MGKEKTQILYIHGGKTCKNKKDYIKMLKTRKVSIEKKEGWDGKYLDKKLGKKFHIIRPRMPLQDDAKYEEWKIHFERFFPYLNDNIILVGQSLGGIFLAKYLSENKFPKKIFSIYLVCPPFDNSLPGEDLSGGFKLKNDLSLVEKNCKNINLLFSEKDDVVPVSHAKKYKEKLKNVRIVIYKNVKGHFEISKFPDIVKMIKKDLKNME
ncbi:hypothetical protein COU59_02780 [Candidatus Pacearchaeota archaeon CG10_big_fil_rev_8_21_14_0_10_34_12]|nr:MAG: hypothetical protein COU59_02780 [Candidatus Pacearchaeota archaeon CG10_big_fil_rev_8_21_14_0_10_34_12]